MQHRKLGGTIETLLQIRYDVQRLHIIYLGAVELHQQNYHYLGQPRASLSHWVSATARLSPHKALRKLLPEGLVLLNSPEATSSGTQEHPGKCIFADAWKTTGTTHSQTLCPIIKLR